MKAFCLRRVKTDTKGVGIVFKTEREAEDFIASLPQEGGVFARPEELRVFQKEICVPEPPISGTVVKRFDKDETQILIETDDTVQETKLMPLDDEKIGSVCLVATGKTNRVKKVCLFTFELNEQMWLTRELEASFEDAKLSL